MGIPLPLQIHCKIISVNTVCNSSCQMSGYLTDPWMMLTGSRAGALIAACWATMMHMGEDGYVESTRKIVETRQYIEKELRSVPGVYVCGKPATSVIAVGSNEFNIYRLSDALVPKGWHFNALQFPARWRFQFDFINECLLFVFFFFFFFLSTYVDNIREKSYKVKIKRQTCQQGN